MLGKFKGGTEWILPLASHSAVHAVFTYLICLFFLPWGIAIQLAALDFGIHFIVDRIKASPYMLGRFESLSKRDFIEHSETVALLEEASVENSQAKDILREELDRWGKRLKSNKYFWWALGADQTAHHLTHYFIIYKILSAIITSY
jgi:hypothetical protein